MRDLIKMLIDPGTDFYELGLDAGYDIGKKRLYGGEITNRKNAATFPAAA